MIIGITGRAGSGKDTVADILVNNHGFVKVAFADPLKRIVRDVFRFTEEQLWGSSEKRNAMDLRFPRSVARNEQGDPYLTPRYALQQLGTEWGRRCYDDVWVDYALRVAERLLERNDTRRRDGHVIGYDKKVGITSGYESNGWRHANGVVISDVRFPNEVEALHAKGAAIWRTMHGEGLAGAAAAHESESYFDQLKVDAVVPGTLGLEALPGIVAEMLLEAAHGTRTAT